MPTRPKRLLPVLLLTWACAGTSATSHDTDTGSVTSDTDTDAANVDCDTVTEESACWQTGQCTWVRAWPSDGHGANDTDATPVSFCMQPNDTDCTAYPCGYTQPGGNCLIFPSSCGPEGWSHCEDPGLCGA